MMPLTATGATVGKRRTSNIVANRALSGASEGNIWGLHNQMPNRTNLN